MKRKLIVMVLAVICLLTVLTVPAMAYQNYNLYIDNVKVPTVPNLCYGENGETEGTYYMDAQPQIKDGRAYVPVQVISKFLGADIAWQRPDIHINYQGAALTLTLGSKTAIRNDDGLTLDAAPYAKNGRTMVPLRFIAEAFGCRVGYANNKVYVNTEPLYIGDTKVVAAQNRIRMTMGGIIYETKTNVCVSRLYQFLLNGCGEEIAAPEHYGEMVNLDIPDYYYMGNEISFMEVAGVEGTVSQQFKIYKRIYNNKQMAEMGFAGTDLGDWLICDVTNDKWYKFTADDFNKAFSDVTSTGDWKEIFNNVV